eukprot:s1365_g23.t2
MAASDVTVVRADLLQRLKEGESCRLVLGPCPPELLADKDLMLKALEFNAYAVEYLAPPLLEELEIWMTATKQNFHALRSCSADLLGDKETALSLIEADAFALRYLSPELRSDREVVLQALKGTGLALEFASAELRGEREVVEKAVQKDGLALEFACLELQKDEAIALEAVKSNTAVIRILPESLSRSMSFLLQAAVAGGSSILRFVAPEFASDKVFVLHVIKSDCTALKHCPKELQDDPSLQLAAVKAGGPQGSAALELAPKALHTDRAFLLRCAKITPQALRLAPEELQKDRSFVMEAVRARGAALQFALFEFRMDHDVVLEAVKQDLGALATSDRPVSQWFQPLRRESHTGFQAKRLSGRVFRGRKGSVLPLPPRALEEFRNNEEQKQQQQQQQQQQQHHHHHHHRHRHRHRHRPRPRHHRRPRCGVIFAKRFEQKPKPLLFAMVAAPRPRASVVQRGQAAVRKPAAPSACDGPEPCTPVAHQEGSSEDQGCRLEGRYPISLVLAMVIMDLLPGIVEFRSASASDFLDFHTAVRWLLFSRIRTSGIAVNVAGPGLLWLLLSKWGYSARLAPQLLRGCPECFLFGGFLLRFLEECLSPRFLLTIMVFLKQVFVRVLMLSTAIYSRRWIADGFRKVVQLCSPRASTERSMAKKKASRSDLKEKIRNLEDQVECLKIAVQLAEKESGVCKCKICYEEEEVLEEGYALPGQVDIVFKLCPGSEVLEARNNFPVTLKLSLSQDGMYFAALGHLPPGRSSWNFRANYVRIQWTKTKELLAQAPKGVLGLFGQPCFDTSNLTFPNTEWQVPQVVVRPQNCFTAMLSKHCCHPLRPQCWGYNTLLAMACCAVSFEPSTSTCLVSNPKFPNSNQDCRGRPVNFFRTFGDGNELRLVVGGRIWQSPPHEINASLSVGCLFQSVVYLFHELHHLSRDAKFLQAMSTHQLHLYVRLFQELVLACDLEDDDFFQLSGLLPNQMLYLVWLTTGRRYDWLLDRIPRPSRPLIIDIGTAGGLETWLRDAQADLFVLLCLQWKREMTRVTRVTIANPLAANCSKSRLTRQMRTGKLKLLNAKISTGIGQDVFLGSSHALDFERAGEAELPRYESNRFEKKVHLPTTSCGDLVAKYGTPWYMKVDVEDATKICLDSLVRLPLEARPALISAESLDQRTLAPGCALHGASQLVESASGLFGDAAADVLTGLGDFRRVTAWSRWRMSKEVQLMRPATELLGRKGLQQQLKDDGYLYLQQVLPRDLVAAARKAVLAALEESGMVLKGENGKLNPEANCATDQGAVPASLARSPEMLALVESDELKQLMQEILGSEAVQTLDHKWLRAVGRGENSGFHTDSVYLNKGSREGLTCWIPLGDVDLRLGGLCVVGRSHCDPSFDKVRQTYSAIDVETAGIRGTGWFTEDPHEILSYGCPLLTAPFSMTDMVVFRLDTMHGSLSNGSQPGEVRISCDTRWYDANDPDGVDARYMGENPVGTATWWVNRHNKEVGCALEPCRHHAFCLRCSQRLVDLKEKCPLCREEVTGLTQTYVS